jgi:hypothetical protein
MNPPDVDQLLGETREPATGSRGSAPILTFALRGHISEIRTVCVRSASTDLCGGCRATGIPTATAGLAVPLVATRRPALEAIPRTGATEGSHGLERQREAALASQSRRKSFQTTLTQALSMTYRHHPGESPESSVQHRNLPYNQGNQQFDGRQWYWLTVIIYTGTIERTARPC